MSAIRTLVIMQLKEKLNLKGRKIKSKNTIFSFILNIVKFALVTALCFGILFLARYLQLFSLINAIPRSVILVVFTIMLIISCISATWGLNKSLYYSNDNRVLLTLPCTPTQVYLSKLIVFYIYEYIKNLFFMIPLFFAYGIISGYALYYYPWILFAFLFVSMIPVLIGAILSIPTMWLYNFLRQYKYLQFTLLLIVIAGVTFGLVKVISIIPENIDLIRTWGTTYWQIQDFLAKFTQTFMPVDKIVIMLVGVREGLAIKLFTINNLINLGYLLVGLLVIFGLGLLIVRPLFYKMASKPFEYIKNNKKNKKNKATSKHVSTLKTEFLLSVRNSEKTFTNIGLLIAMPVLIFLLNKIFAAMNTRMLGNNMTISFNILIILLVALTSNYYAASIFSKDGRSSYLIKVQPTKYEPLLFAKLIYNTLFMLVAFIATFFVLLNSTSLGLAKSLLIVGGCLFFYFAHLFVSAEMDIMNPQIELYATIGENETNPNETKSTVLAFLVSFVIFGVMLFLLIENNGIITYVKMFLLGLFFMMFRLYMLRSKIKLYYKEK